MASQHTIRTLPGLPRTSKDTSSILRKVHMDNPNMGNTLDPMGKTLI